MMTLSLLVVMTLVVTMATHSLLVQSASIGDVEQNLPATSSSETNNLPAAPFNRFDKCKLKPNPRVRDLIAHRLCIKRILEKEGGTGVGGRWGRSVNNKLQHQMAMIEDILFVHEGADKHRLVRSLEEVCAGDLGHYDHDVREYIQWRCKNGYGEVMRRWGRSAAAGSTTPVRGLDFENDVLKENKKWVDYFGGDDNNGGSVKRYKLFYKGLTKRDDADDMRAIVKAYREWRSQKGYSQTSGRWG